MEDIWNQVKYLITNKDLSYLQQSQQHQLIQQIPNYSFIPNSIVKFWYSKSSNQQKLLLLNLLLLSASIYILLPSLPFSNQQRMFSKRPDKNITGLINLRNDCFANSSLQAYSSLPSLTEYLNKFITSFNQLFKFIVDKKINIDELVKLRLELNKNLQNSKFKSANTKFNIPLHIAMAKMVKKLQETQMTSRTISVWTFLHELENIFNAKISRSQHDAHELTQLINETLENENLKIKSFLRFITLNLHTILSNQLIPKDYAELEKIIIPEFPFDGLILSQMTCLSCHGVSKPLFTPFVILTLPVPMAQIVELETLLEENEKESIEGYQCLRCIINKIHANEEHITRQIRNDEEEKFIREIFKLHSNPSLCINEDIPEALENYIKNYKVQGIDVSQITSTVQKNSQILKPPKIFGLHLSRSSFDGQVITRNSCRVKFTDHLTLSIGKEYHEKLKQFQNIVQSEEEKMMDKISFSGILTNDENDMEDEDVQRGDFDEKGEEDEDEEEVETDDGTATETGLSTDDLDEDETDLEDGSSITSQESIPQTITTSTTIIPNDSNNTQINNAPITDKQTDDLKERFKRFKFNDNDIYKYRLRAVIRHMGSHSQGHYECYKRKPLFVKDKDGNIFKLSPEIMDDLGDVHCGVEPANRRSSSSGSEHDEGFRHRFSSLMGRRPSVIQADPKNVEEIIQSGLQTPAEILVDDLNKNNFDDAFASANFKKQFHEPKQSTKPKEKVKMKKINSLITNPYWRISDANTSEVSTASVLAEEQTVYMLYYERVDRKQIRRNR
ncbi:unnamed protein product [Candida verbasci]|uniref:USP domain-containing protein n=1 Tax=Candida verbasci TaxID=1227364 RepID=A0A9W4XB05_9ASCO|nr:unnamed protein product [Candida verbasci]